MKPSMSTIWLIIAGSIVLVIGSGIWLTREQPYLPSDHSGELALPDLSAPKNAKAEAERGYQPSRDSRVFAENGGEDQVHSESETDANAASAANDEAIPQQETYDTASQLDAGGSISQTSPERVFGEVSDPSRAATEARGLLAADVGLQEAELWQAEGQLLMDVSIRSSQRCQLGDLDIIHRDLALAGGSELLATIEPIVGEGAPLATTRIPVSEIEMAHHWQFSLPASEQPGHLGFYLCRDMARLGSCRNKSVSDLNLLNDRLNILELKQKAQVSKASDQLPDSIYVFQYLYIDGNRVRFLGDDYFSETMYEQLSDYVATTLGLSSSEVRRVIGRVKELMTTIRTVPMATGDRQLVLDLPQHHAEHCQPQTGG